MLSLGQQAAYVTGLQSVAGLPPAEQDEARPHRYRVEERLATHEAIKALQERGVRQHAA